ncbi:hypothetical protein AYI70_g2787 [Smittium culicis]|uniref:Uncharacterized protein n=1 Tax=Smittium culicis TaxID=133412 RepID=A0A1R1Y6K6_9FUNG|nr:hypothetical protein AYI70_g2787 [Smittium culicis]
MHPLAGSFFLFLESSKYLQICHYSKQSQCIWSNRKFFISSKKKANTTSYFLDPSTITKNSPFRRTHKQRTYTTKTRIFYSSAV